MLNIKKARREYKQFDKAINNLAKNVRAMRKERGWDAEKLAMWSDVSESTVNNVECCRTNVSIYTVARLAEAFGKGVWEMYSPVGDEQ